ncbi:MAG: hypothetical protein ACLUN5_18620 [Oscillospiraceae bacterium]
MPLSLAAAYENLAAKLGKTITDEDKENAAHIYTMIAGNANGSDGTGASGSTIQIDYGSGTGSTELDTSGFTNPAGKNADDLVQYAHPCLSGALGLCVGNVRSCTDREPV